MENVVQLIMAYLADQAAHPPVNGDIRSYVITDEARGHFLLVDAGWIGVQRVHAALVHVRLDQDMMIIECDNTPEGGIAAWLEAHGVSAEAICYPADTAALAPAPR